MCAMHFKTMPKEAVSELLFYLAEQEEFSSLDRLGGDVTVQETRSVFRELAEQLRREADAEWSQKDYNAQKDRSLSKEARDIISYLSPGEERTLLTAFGLVEGQKRASESSSK